jgi:hypothetical protein
VDLVTMPIYARAGSIIPLGPIRQYTGEPVSDSTTLKVFPGASGEFTLYDDDGTSQEYLTGRGSWTRIVWNDATRTTTLEPNPPAGTVNVVVPRRFRILLPDGVVRDVTYDGRRVVASPPAEPPDEASHHAPARSSAIAAR